MVMRFDPFRELDRLSSDVWQSASRRATASVMPIDAYRQGDSFVVHFDIPGVDPESVDLTVEKNVLTVRAERDASWGADAELIVAERPQGSFSRQIFLAETLDSERIEASYDAGVLTVRIPVAEAAKPRRVAIGQRDSGSTAITTGATPS
ncbi:MAG TPA: Hsp20/alpha crystallin family protein [Acidimicrobiales bacterium]|nr:Hsp20/alpha crystallin family protein [Acidimicrobiales bacterium]